tara:strand:- start:39 stop:1001 length:963 start_codon:yes stop_codon:yes gene_type:complete
MFNYALDKRMSSLTNNIMMIRPVSFSYNKETAVNNFYQRSLNNFSKYEINEKACREFDDFVEKLILKGVNVISFDDTINPITPDSVFPNNWISFHYDATVALYPMYAKNRRYERRLDILDSLNNQFNFKIEKVLDYTKYESKNIFLEGTGSMVLDRRSKLCYASLSSRTNKKIIKKFCTDFNYEPVIFNSYQNVGSNRLKIYHTNVMMCVADEFVVICLDSIDCKNDLLKVKSSIEKSNKEIIEINEDQKHHFAGNMLQIKGGDDKFLVMSSTAYSVLTEKQIKQINKFCSIIHSPLNIIETCGGGSARCMMAEIFLPKK